MEVIKWIEPGAHAITQPSPLTNVVKSDPTFYQAMNRIEREEHRERRRREKAGHVAKASVKGKELRKQAPRIRVWIAC